MPKLFRYRLIIPHIAIVSGLFLLSLLSSILIFKNESLKIHIKRLNQISMGVEDIIKTKKEIPFSELKDIAKVTNSRITIINSKGDVLFDTEVEDIKILDNHLLRPEILEASRKGEGISIRFSNTLKERMIYFSRKIKLKDEELFLRVSVPYTQLKEKISTAKRSLLLYLLIFFSATIFFIVKIFNYFINPIEDIIFASNQFSKGDFDYKIPTSNMKGEIKSLAITLNNMAQKIKENMLNLEKSIKTIKSITDNLEEAICIYSNNEILYGNVAFCRLFNSHKPQGHTIAEIIRDKEIIQTLSQMKDKSISKEVLINSRYFLLKLYPFRTEGMKDVMVVVFYDIDKTKRLDIIKRDFIANFSHEIKTPLTVIKTNIETIAIHNLTDEEKDFFIESTQKNIERIENIINDIITLNYLESEPPLKFEEIKIAKIIDEIISVFKTKINQNNISLEIDIDERLQIKSDREILEKILVNLIDNAIKYNTTNGFIRIKAEKGNGLIKIIFENSGKTIPQEYLERIFERFFTIDKSRSRLMGGTGLGLSIVKHAVERLGGSIKASSTLNSNIFTLTLPSD